MSSNITGSWKFNTDPVVTSSTGTQEIPITYTDSIGSTSFLSLIVNSAKSPVRINITSFPIKYTYTIGDILDTSGMEVYAYLSDKSAKLVPKKSDTENGWYIDNENESISAAGTKIYTVKYNIDGKVLTDTFIINCIEGSSKTLEVNESTPELDIPDDYYVNSYGRISDYHIVYVYNVFESDSTVVDISYDSSFTIITPRVTTNDLGCAFDCWNSSSVGDGVPYTPGQVVDTNLADRGQVFFLYAKWKENQPPSDPTMTITLTTDGIVNPGDVEEADIVVTPGVDPEGLPVTTDLECTSDNKDYVTITRTGDHTFHAYFRKGGIFEFTATCKDVGNATSKCVGYQNLEENHAPNAPTIVMNSSDNNFDLDTLVGFTATATDPDGDDLTFRWYIDDVPVDGELTDVLSQRKYPQGTHTCYCVAVDIYNQFSENSNGIVFSIIGKYLLVINSGLDNKAPTEPTLIANPSEVNLGSDGTATSNLTITPGTDPEGDTLSFKLECTSSNSSKVTLTKIDDLHYTAKFSGYGLYIFLATNTDTFGNSSSSAAQVTVNKPDGSFGGGGTFIKGTTDIVVGNSNSGTYTSDKTEKISQCYIKGISGTLTISSGHGGSEDYIIIYKYNSSGQNIVTANRDSNGEYYEYLTFTGSGTYTGKGNFGSGTVIFKNTTPYTAANDVRQVKIYAATPGHSGCISTSSNVKYTVTYGYDENLD